jgi:hypothetical protein
MSTYYETYPNNTVKEILKELDEDIPVFSAMLKHITLWSKKQ